VLRRDAALAAAEPCPCAPRFELFEDFLHPVLPRRITPIFRGVR
jgi:hypothetical protein